MPDVAIDVAMQCYPSPTRTLAHPGLILILLHKIPWACSSSTLNLMFLMHLFLFQSLNFLKDWDSPGRFWSTREKKTQLSLQRSKVRRAVFEEVCTMDVLCVELQ